MTLLKLASFSILMTLSFQAIVILGEKFLTSETSKDGELKAPEKRTNNFRVPMDMSYDPNFWPARGRRSRREPEKINRNDKCVTSDGNFMCSQMSGVQDEESERRKALLLDFLLPTDLDDEQLSGNDKMDGDCYESAMPFRMRELPQSRLVVRAPESNFMPLKRLNEQWPKKRRRFDFPQFVLYENNGDWEPENLYGEKRKKQDVFWVARGKKSFNFLQK